MTSDQISKNNFDTILLNKLLKRRQNFEPIENQVCIIRPGETKTQKVIKTACNDTTNIASHNRTSAEQLVQ